MSSAKHDEAKFQTLIMLLRAYKIKKMECHENADTYIAAGGFEIFTTCDTKSFRP